MKSRNIDIRLVYFLRLYVAERKISYVLSFYGLIDLIAIVPFYLLPGVDLRSLRVFRLLSLFRLMKLFRYNRAIHQLSRALIIAKEEIVLFSLITLMLLYLSAVGIYYFENEAQPEAFKSVFHSLWWAVATLSTVGYGDMYTNLISIFRLFIQPMISKFAVSNERNSQ